MAAIVTTMRHAVLGALVVLGTGLACGGKAKEVPPAEGDSDGGASGGASTDGASATSASATTVATTVATGGMGSASSASQSGTDSAGSASDSTTTMQPASGTDRSTGMASAASESGGDCEPLGQDPCLQCISNMCCPQLEVCAGEPTCSCWYDCFASGTFDCYTMCGGFPGQEAQAVIGCAFDTCGGGAAAPAASSSFCSYSTSERGLPRVSRNAATSMTTVPAACVQFSAASQTSTSASTLIGIAV